MSEDLVFKTLVQINQQLDRIQSQLEKIMTAMDMPSIALTVTRLSDTVAGPGGQVTPGSMVLHGNDASEYFKTLQNPTVLPLQDLPPWTHMALANGSWWLLTMG